MKDKIILTELEKSDSMIKYIAWPLTALSVVTIIILIFFKLGNLMDSDTAGEILLAREVLLEHTIFPTGWFYSTEIRVLNIHLFIAPLLKITGDMMLSKSIANIIMITLLVLSYYVLMKSMKVNRTYILLFLPAILTPLSLIMLNMLYAGAFYTPYIICIMIVLAIMNFIDSGSLSVKMRRLSYFFLVLLSFALGVTGTRFLTNLFIPIMGTEIILLWMEIKEYENISYALKNMKIGHRTTINVLMIVMSLGGFLYNKLVISKTLHYLDVGNQSFADINSISNRFFLSINTMIRLFGGIDSGKLITFNGVKTVLNLFLFILIILISYDLIKKRDILNKGARNFVIFFWVALIFNLYILTFTEIQIEDRYHLNVMMLIFPMSALYFEQFKGWLYSPKRPLTLILLTFCIITSQYQVMYKDTFKQDTNKERYEVINYLKKNELNFGYATFWNANVMTVLSNGAVEVANLDYSVDKSPYLWLTPNRVYNPKYHPGKTFLLLTKEEESKATQNLLKDAKKLKEINGFAIYIYDNNEFDFT